MIAFKSHIWHKKLSFCNCYGRNNVSRKSVNPLVVYLFYCMAFFTPRRNVIILINVLNLLVKPSFFHRFSEKKNDFMHFERRNIRPNGIFFPEKK